MTNEAVQQLERRILHSPDDDLRLVKRIFWLGHSQPMDKTAMRVVKGYIAAQPSKSDPVTDLDGVHVFSRSKFDGDVFLCDRRLMFIDDMDLFWACCMIKKHIGEEDGVSMLRESWYIHTCPLSCIIRKEQGEAGNLQVRMAPQVHGPFTDWLWQTYMQNSRTRYKWSLMRNEAARLNQELADIGYDPRVIERQRRSIIPADLNRRAYGLELRGSQLYYPDRDRPA